MAQRVKRENIAALATIVDAAYLASLLHRAKYHRAGQWTVGPLGFVFDNGRCMFCPGSGTKRAQAKTQPNGSALALQAAFDDINIHKGRSVYYWFGLW